MSYTHSAQQSFNWYNSIRANLTALQWASIEPEYTRPQKLIFTKPFLYIVAYPTFNFFEAVHFILTYSYNEPPNETNLYCVTLLLKLHSFFTYFYIMCNFLVVDMWSQISKCSCKYSLFIYFIFSLMMET
jgi:hypothetical protein